MIYANGINMESRASVMMSVTSKPDEPGTLILTIVSEDIEPLHIEMDRYNCDDLRCSAATALAGLQ